MGLGRSGDRVLNTPVIGLRGSPRGMVSSTPRSARSSQVSTRISVPGRRSRIASATPASKTSQAGGAPSSGCMGAWANSVSGDSTQPTGTTSIVISASFQRRLRIGKTRIGDARFHAFGPLGNAMVL